MTGSFRHFSAEEIQQGLHFALTEHHMQLDRDTLRNLANKTGSKWYENGRTPGMLQQAKRDVLHDYLQQHTKMEAARRNVYSRTVSKLFSIRSVHALKQRNANKVQKPACSIDPNDIGLDKNGQYMLFLPQAS